MAPLAGFTTLTDTPTTTTNTFFNEELGTLRLLSEPEWRGIGITQSLGWEHCEVHAPEPHVLLFRRPKDYVPPPQHAQSKAATLLDPNRHHVYGAHVKFSKHARPAVRKSEGRRGLGVRKDGRDEVWDMGQTGDEYAGNKKAAFGAILEKAREFAGSAGASGGDPSPQLANDAVQAIVRETVASIMGPLVNAVVEKVTASLLDCLPTAHAQTTPVQLVPKPKPAASSLEVILTTRCQPSGCLRPCFEAFAGRQRRYS
uniref:Cyclin-dependent kinases regulatory subunit n=1 Tax=Mycena chlorophos TaxID=658473 RepID=A0ABQ0LAS9_MYCCL|nr:cyclin-dependent kinase regulatory subunit [Mycena chlorophos]